MAVFRQKMMTSSASKKNTRELSGSAHVFVFVVLAILFASGGGYLYSVNQSAVQGYHMRTLEKEIDTLKQENAKLRIAEADLRSLKRIEESQEELQMKKLEHIKYLEEQNPPVVSVHQSGQVAVR